MTNLQILIVIIVVASVTFYLREGLLMARYTMKGLKHDYATAIKRIGEIYKLGKQPLDPITYFQLQTEINDLQRELFTLSSILFTRKGIFLIYKVVYTKGMWRNFKTNWIGDEGQ